MDATTATAVETLTLRFQGESEDGSDLHELQAAHVAQVLQGLVELSSDFNAAGAFGENQAGGTLLVRPPQDGSFLIEVIRFAAENPEATAMAGGALGFPTLSQAIWWSTKSARADVRDFEHLENGQVKVTWQDDTVDEIPPMAWQELKKHKKRRKKQLRKIMAPLADERVSTVAVNDQETAAAASDDGPAGATFELTRPDYQAVRPEDDQPKENSSTFEAEAQMSAVDFDNPAKWRVKTATETRAATVEDPAFLQRVAAGLAIGKSDIFRLRIRRDTVERNGRKRTTWTVLRVESFRKASG